MKNLRGGKLAAGLLAVLGLACIFGSPMAFAQGSQGRISGTVRDTTGAVIPGALVTLRNEASGTVLRTTANVSGLYDFNYIPVATYTLRVSTKGFKAYVLTGIHVAPGAVLEENAALQVGAQVQTVEVQGGIVNLIPKSSGGEITTITEAQIQNESTIGRDSLELLTLLPGVVGGTGAPGSISGGFSGASGSGFQTVGGMSTQGINGFNVNGLRSDQNMVKLDNANAIDPGENGGFMIEPNMDMIQEFTVKQSGFEASQGGGGVIVDAVTKSGGSQIHGEGYYYLRNAAFNANDWSNDQARIAKPNSKFNYPGFNIGGPVRIPGTSFNKNNDKMFFFYGVEWQRQLADPGTQLRTVPTEAMRNGDFSALLNPKYCQTNSQGVVTGGNYLSMPCIVKDPATGKQADYNGQLNVLPPGEVTAAGQAVLNGTYVLPNYVDPNGNANLAAHPLYPTNRIENTVRIDYNLSTNTRAFLRLAQNSDHEYYPYGLWSSGQGDGWGGNVPRVSPVVGHDSGENAALNVVRVISPSLTNETEFSVGAINYPYKYADPSKMASSDLLKTLPGVNWAAGTPGASPVYTRTVEIPGVWNGQPPNSQTWGQGDQYGGVFGNKTTFELTDNLTKVLRTHTLQFGFDMNHTRNDQNQANVNGNIWSNVGFAGITSTGNVFGDLLDQSVYQWSQSTNDPDGMWRFWNYEWYGQDSWKVNRKLTLNYGARFAYFPPWYEARGEVSTFNPAVWTAANDANIYDGIQVGSGYKLVENQPYIPASIRGLFVGGLPSSGGFPNPPITIEPRLGFAYDLFGTGKTVIRAGAGIYEERDQGNTVFGAAQNPPFVFSTSITASTRYDPTAANPALTGFGYYTTLNPYSGQGSISPTMYDTHDNHGAENYSYNFTVDQDIGHQTVLEAAYVGTVGRHLYIENIFDPIPLGAMWEPGTENPVPNAGNSGVQNSFRYYKPFGALNLLHHVSTSNYNSLQVTVRRNVSHGLTLLASYTWSKTLGYSGGYNGTVDPFDSQLNYGLTSYSLPQIVNFSYIYQLPNLGARYFSGHKIAGGILDNWQISGITNFQSGAPQSYIGGSGTIGTVNCYEGGVQNAGLCSNFNANGVGWYGTPDRTLSPTIMFNPQKGVNFKGVGSQWLNPGSITIPQINQLGTTEVPQFLGPGSNNFDFTLFKSFRLGEHRRLEFRIAAFDIFNRAQLDTPAQDAVANPNFNFNLPAGATSFTQGVVSPVTNGSPACTGGNTVGCILDKHGHREMEMAIKLYF